MTELHLLSMTERGEFFETEGFLSSLIELLQLPITAPNYTTLSRRQAGVNIPTYQQTIK